MFGIGTTEFLVILLVGVMVLGPEHLPKIMRTVTKAMSDFRRVSTDFQRTINLEVNQEEWKREQAAKTTVKKKKKKKPAPAPADEQADELTAEKTAPAPADELTAEKTTPAPADELAAEKTAPKSGVNGIAEPAPDAGGLPLQGGSA